MVNNVSPEPNYQEPDVQAEEVVDAVEIGEEVEVEVEEEQEDVEEGEIIVPVNIAQLNSELKKSQSDNKLLKERIEHIKEEAKRIIEAKNRQIRDLKENLNLAQKTLERMRIDHYTIVSDNTEQQISQPQSDMEQQPEPDHQQEYQQQPEVAVVQEMAKSSPVRRRLRQKTGGGIREEARKNLLNLLKESDDSKRDLEVKIIPGRQRAVFTTRAFSRMEFVLEYAGDLMTAKQAKVLEKEYEADPSKGSFQYYFRFR